MFVGTLAVAPRRDLIRHLEALPLAGPMAMERALHAKLMACFPLPRAAEAQDLGPGDLAFDVVIEGHRQGGSADLLLGHWDLPLWWRPRIQLVGRLFTLRSNQARGTFRVTQRMPWGDYVSRLLSWKVMFGLQQVAGRMEMEQLLQGAADKLLARVLKAV